MAFVHVIFYWCGWPLSLLLGIFLKHISRFAQEILGLLILIIIGFWWVNEKLSEESEHIAKLYYIKYQTLKAKEGEWVRKIIDDLIHIHENVLNKLWEAFRFVLSIGLIINIPLCLIALYDENFHPRTSGTLQVVSHVHHRPVAGAVVRITRFYGLFSWTEAEGRTDAQGFFHWEDIPCAGAHLPVCRRVRVHIEPPPVSPYLPRTSFLYVKENNDLDVYALWETVPSLQLDERYIRTLLFTPASFSNGIKKAIHKKYVFHQGLSGTIFFELGWREKSSNKRSTHELDQTIWEQYAIPFQEMLKKAEQACHDPTLHLSLVQAPASVKGQKVVIIFTEKPNVHWAGEWVDSSNPPSILLNTFYLHDMKAFKSVFLHEVGHALGLGHSPYPDDVMYTGGNEKLDDFSTREKLLLRGRKYFLEDLKYAQILFPGIIGQLREDS